MSELETQLQGFDDYIGKLCSQEDDALASARANMKSEGLPAINVSANEGKLLHVLVQAVGAKRILEIGTLGGYSAIWMARGLPSGGRLVSLEIDEHHAKVARDNVARAGLTDKVEVKVGPGLETLSSMLAAGEPLFDVAFIDADKEGYPAYLDKVVPLVRQGGLILADNTLNGGLLEEGHTSGIATYNAATTSHPELVTIILPIIRGHIDGLTVSVKTAL